MTYPAAEAAFLVRMSYEEKDRLAAEAREAGISMRALVHLRVFGKTCEVGKPGPKPRRSQEELPMTG